MRLDGSDVTALAVIALAGGFGVVATGSTTLRATDAERVVVEARAPERTVVVRTDVAERIRADVAARVQTALSEKLEEEVEQMTVRPAIYVDGVLVEPASVMRDLDPTGVQNVTVLRDRNEIRIESRAR